jgi:Ni,Fe-hydrogenase III component G
VKPVSMKWRGTSHSMTLGKSSKTGRLSIGIRHETNSGRETIYFVLNYKQTQKLKEFVKAFLEQENPEFLKEAKSRKKVRG